MQVRESYFIFFLDSPTLILTAYQNAIKLYYLNKM